VRRATLATVLAVVAASCGGDGTAPYGPTTSPAAAEVHVLGAEIAPETGADAILAFAAHNAGAETDTLEAASCICAEGTTVEGDAAITPQETAIFNADGPHVVLEGVDRSVRPGDFVDVTLTFANAGDVAVTAEVVRDS